MESRTRNEFPRRIAEQGGVLGHDVKLPTLKQEVGSGNANEI